MYGSQGSVDALFRWVETFILLCGKYWGQYVQNFIRIRRVCGRRDKNIL